MTANERRAVKNLVKCVSGWYATFKYSSNNVNFPYINGKYYELVSYGYKELFNLCNTIQTVAYVLESEAFNSYNLRCFFKALDKRIMKCEYANVNYVNTLKIAVIRSAIEALH